LLYTYEEKVKFIIKEDARNRGDFEEKFFKRILQLKLRRKRLRKFFKELNKTPIKDELYLKRKKKTLDILKKLGKNIEEETDKQAQKISNKLIKENYTPTLRKLPHQVKGKDVYTTKKFVDSEYVESAESTISQKIARDTILENFKIRFSNRDEIIGALIPIIEDKSNKLVFRTDISSFYESIEHNKIKEMINPQKKIGQSTKNLVNGILDQYKEITGLEKGLPRGVPLSATLAELCMAEFDNEILGIPEVNYYARYVDDIVLIVKTKDSSPESYEKVIRSLKDKLSDMNLSINEQKTEKNIYCKEAAIAKIDFL